MTAAERAQMDTDLATLKALLTPERWTKRASARDNWCVMCHPLSDRAIRWCVIGAAEKLFGRYSGCLPFLHGRACYSHGMSADELNDELGYDAVVALLHPVTDAEAAS